MKNILYLVPGLYNPGGMERILTEKINHLVGLGKYNIHVLTTDQLGRPLYFDLDHRVEISHLDLDFDQYFHTGLIRKFISTKRLLQQYKQLLTRYIAEKKIDVCISLGGKELEFFSTLQADVKKICELHFAKDNRKQFLLARSSSLIYKLLGEVRTYQLIQQTKRLHKLVVLTKADEEQWKKTHRNIVQIYNFSSVERNAVSALSGKRAVAIGKLDPQKGFDMLIDAWKDVYVAHPTWTLSIYGQGEWKTMLQSKIDAYGLAAVVRLMGVSNDIGSVLLESDLFVFSSRYEGFPMVLLESIACGVPIVSFDCKTGPNEIITDNDCGILVEAENTVLLGAAINTVLRQDKLRKQMGVAAKEKSKQFSKEKIMKQWEDLLDRI